jgi:hypothetical protein
LQGGEHYGEEDNKGAAGKQLLELWETSHANLAEIAGFFGPYYFVKFHKDVGRRRVMQQLFTSFRKNSLAAGFMGYPLCENALPTAPASDIITHYY